jgi:hypothetical protein
MEVKFVAVLRVKAPVDRPAWGAVMRDFRGYPGPRQETCRRLLVGGDNRR